MVRSIHAAIVAAFTLFASGPAAAALVLGAQAPPFVLPNAAGNEVTLRSFAGRPLVLNVFASWCPPCLIELPRIAAAARANGDRVAFVGVDEQEPMTMALAFIREAKIPYQVVFDRGQFQASYGAVSLPETVFVDARGRVAAVVHGAISAAELARDLAKIERPRATPART
jgi:thiol-disulfide isomerase/thioredoxin